MADARFPVAGFSGDQQTRGQVAATTHALVPKTAQILVVGVLHFHTSFYLDDTSMWACTIAMWACTPGSGPGVV